MWGQPPRLSLERSSSLFPPRPRNWNTRRCLPRQAHRRFPPGTEYESPENPTYKPHLTSASVHIQNDLYKMFPQERFCVLQIGSTDWRLR
jgi:hypothetical protein